MKIRSLLTLMTFGGVVALVACSSDPDEKFGSSDSFCSSKAEAECNNLAKQRCGATVEACKAKRVTACTTAASAATGAGRSYRANAAQACIDKINEVYKDGAATVTAETEAEATKVCDRVYGGSKKEKEPCATTFECEGSLVCDGICVAQSTVKIGGGCANAGEICETGSYCQPQGGRKFCVAKNTLDENCGPDNPCIEALRCSTRCVAKVANGGACDRDDECGDGAAYCDLTSTPRKCRPKYESSTPACKEFGSPL